MKNEKYEQPFNISNIVNIHLRLNRVIHCLFFIIGLSLGIIGSFYLKSFLFNLQASSSLTSTLLPSSSWSPPPPTLSIEMPRGSDVKSREEITSPMHDMDDDLELFAKVWSGKMDEVLHHKQKPKVAFMFLTRWGLPLGPLWEKFFGGHEELYSIYVHPDPSFNESAVPENSVFYGRRIPSKRAGWGSVTMIDAERRLLANALLDPSNQRFVLLSDSCIPLFNFTTVYNYLINSNYSFVGSFDDPRKVGRGRYNRQMWPELSISQWRKGSQWFEVHREIAVKIISDRKYYNVFKKYCLPPCYNDEHYIPTLINILSPELNSNRSVTWVDWSTRGPHPRKFSRPEITVEFLNYVRFGSNCTYNGNTTSICFLFARKFVAKTLTPLLQIAPTLLGFGS